LRPEDFDSDSPGHLVTTTGGNWAFVPAPLSPKLTFPLDIISLIAEADNALGELAGVGKMLPNPRLLISPFLHREAVLSSRIEGSESDLEDLFRYEAEQSAAAETGDVREVHNYVLALERGLELLESMPISLWMIRQLHQILLTGVRGSDKHPGEYRRDQVFIGRRGARIDSARFVPPPPTEVEPALVELHRFISTPSELPHLVELALIHYQFEAIHPFSDGNGRIGRLLIPLILIERGRLPEPLFYLSEYFERFRSEYYDHLLRVSLSGEWIEWIRFFLEGIRVQALASIERSTELLDLYDIMRRNLQEIRATGNAYALLDELFIRPTITVSGAASSLGVTPRAARMLIEKFEDMGILEEITGKQRNRVYLAQSIFDVVEAGRG
jgi:Fic family protein